MGSLDGTNATKGLVNYVVLDQDLQLQKFENTDFDPDTLAIYAHAQPSNVSDNFLEVINAFEDIKNETEYEGFTRKLGE